MIAFTFAMALTRYEARITEIVDAANTIGTAALRETMLPEPYKSAAAPLFGEYVELRISHNNAEIASLEMMAANRRALTIQKELWAEAAAAGASNPQVVPTGQFIQPMNEMIDTYEKRLSVGITFRQ